MPLCSNQFFNDLTQSWASVTLYPTSKGMFGMLWFLCYTSPWLPRHETQNITVKIEKQSYRDTRTCRCQSRLYRFIKKISNNKYTDVFNTHKGYNTITGTFSFCEVCHQLLCHRYFSTGSTPFICMAPIADRDNFFIAGRQKSQR